MKNTTKKLLFALSILIVTISGCTSKKEIANDVCKISIDAQNYPLDSISLILSVGKEFKKETIPLKEGKGEIEVKVPELTNLVLINKSRSIKVGEGLIPAPMFIFFAENGHQINISFNNSDWPMVKISGGKVSNEYMLLLKETGMLEKALFENQVQAITLQDTSLQKRLELVNEFKDVQNQITNKKRDFLRANTSSYVSLFVLLEIKTLIPSDEFEKYFMDLNSNLRDTQLGKQIKEYIENAKKTSIDKSAPDFEKKDKNGKIIKLSDYKGKYILLDFWGSWCGPCRASHPHLIELYKKYSPKGMVFISIAHENTSDKKNWLDAIKKDGLIWTQILNNEWIEKSDLLSLYNVTIFPTKILINPDGKIEAKYKGYGETGVNDLDIKLKEVFGN